MSAALHCAAQADWVAIMVEIRPAAAKDAAGIAAVHTEVWRDAYAGLLPADFLARRVITTDIWLSRIMKLGAQFAVQVAVDDTGTVVGFALTGPAVGPAAPEDESVGQLYAIYVLAAYGAQGSDTACNRAASQENLKKYRWFPKRAATRCVSTNQRYVFREWQPSRSILGRLRSRITET